jgi:hypothetical protein
LARFLGLWLRPALRALTSLREVSLRRKPRNLPHLRCGALRAAKGATVIRP